MNRWTLVIFSVTCFLFSATSSASGCFEIKNTIPANTYFIDVQYDGPFFQLDGYMGRIYLVTETPTYNKYFHLSADTIFTFKAVASSAYVQFDLASSTTKDYGSHAVLIRNQSGKIKLKTELSPPKHNGSVEFFPYIAKLSFGDKIEFVSSEILWLGRICWADNKNELPEPWKLSGKPSSIFNFSSAQ